MGLGSRALRNTVLVLAAKVVARLVALVTVLAMIRYLKAAPYGAFATLVNYTAIVSVVLDLGFNVLFVREGARHPNEIQRYLRNVMSVRLLMRGSLPVTPPNPASSPSTDSISRTTSSPIMSTRATIISICPTPSCRRRSTAPSRRTQQSDPTLHAGVVKETDAGIVLKGAQQLGTGAAFSDAVFILLHSPPAAAAINPMPSRSRFRPMRRA